ncbi:MAG: asparagine synthase (glutamine-hydrolyzing) [Alphaproteobacteria bacterium]
MCGIAGLFAPHEGYSAARLTGLAQAAASTLVHRGPDDSGAWADPEAGVGFGHRRLSIIDLSAGARQPMVSACGRYVIVYNGEIYNFEELRKRLSERGVGLRTRSDTEALLESIAAFGLEAALADANGMFAFGLWDRETRTLQLARDRFGQKPLYYGWAGKNLAFGSELKALTGLPGFDTAIDPSAVTQLMRFAMIPAPHTIHPGCWKLLPGTILTIDTAAVERRALPEPVAYWSAAGTAMAGTHDPLNLPDTDAVSALETELQRAVGACMVSDVPLGAFLSGGIDSTAVVATMQGLSDRAIKTFSIGFSEADYNEADAAAEIARHLGTDHTELMVTPADAQAVIPSLPAMYDEPFADSSQIPTYLVSQLARQQVTVSLSGDGGDEVFGGYNRYTWANNLARAFGPVPTALRRLMRGGLESVAPRHWDRLAAMIPGRYRPAQFGDKLHKLAEVLDARDFAAIYARLVSQWKKPERAVPGAGMPGHLVDDPESWPALPSRSEQLMLLDAISYLPDDILVKLDRASMAVSLESRVPYLDHALYAFAWRLPMSQKIRGGTRKWILREVLARHVPREMFERPKMGFGVPVGDWLRGDLREWAESLLSPQRLRESEIIDAGAITAIWHEHLAGSRNHQYLLWPVLMFEAWRAEPRTTATDPAAGYAR